MAKLIAILLILLVCGLIGTGCTQESKSNNIPSPPALPDSDDNIGGGTISNIPQPPALPEV